MINETLSPTWDEVLLFEKHVIYGNRDDIKEMPPIVCIEFFDVDIGVSILEVCFKMRNFSVNFLFVLLQLPLLNNKNTPYMYDPVSYSYVNPTTQL